MEKKVPLTAARNAGDAPADAALMPPVKVPMSDT